MASFAALIDLLYRDLCILAQAVFLSDYDTDGHLDAALTGGVHMPVALDPEEVIAISAPSLLEALGVTGSAYAAGAVELNLGNRLADAYRMMGEHALKRQRAWGLSSIALRWSDRGSVISVCSVPKFNAVRLGAG